ncbi:hypothetical protein DH2020_043115 [Rehmannia glutinosa]|uniref:Uncharacterized protein n=1 Tax=Rehmannia glutinosa TaxID=99300 RepID=A0ABR0ULF8_REHGL
MDVWIVAAAAGAGYVAQRFKKLTMDKYNISDLSSENLKLAPESPGSLRKVHESFGEEMCRQREQSFHSTAEMASTSGFNGENLVMSDNFGSWGVVSNSNSLGGVSNNENTQGDWEVRLDSAIDEVVNSNSVPQSSSREVGFSYGVRRNRSSLRSRQVNSKFIKPRTSLESCLMAQLYKEHAEIEEYTYSVHTPHKPIVRPFLVTDGNRIISRAPHASCSRQTITGNDKLQTKAKALTGNGQVSMRSNKGSSDVALLFYLGLTMGITYSSLGHKTEIEKLRKSLKQSEDLVQDLQEELEMKDASTVKELAVEDYESVDVHTDAYYNDAMQTLSPEQKLDDSLRHCDDEYCDRSAEEEFLRKIEAELEAELDRLASNMNSSRLEGKLSNVAELDPDYVSDVIQGELRADLFGAKTGPGAQAYSDRDGSSSSSTPRSVHYPISPRELSLRLHEVIQSRLEERVKELETALEHSQTKLKCMKPENTHSWTDFPNYKTGNSSDHESPIATDQPVVINLSGEALSAYNDAFEVFTKLSESDEEESKNQDFFRNGGLESCIQQDFVSNGSSETETAFHSQEGDANTNLSNDVVCNSRDESDDEMERLLIRQIVEKARQGSPAVLKAQRALLSIDQNWNRT